MINVVSDIRFTMVGIGLTFAGFLVLGVFGSQYSIVTLEAEQLGDCFEYFEDSPPVPVNCDDKLLDKSLFFIGIVGLLGAGIFALVKGVKGKWDQDVKPKDMLGPGGERKSNNTDEKD